jgi:8-oxo-dGTP pyrophosphatase MutT (NUDIX family)
MQPQLQTSANSAVPLATDPPVSEKQRRAMWAAASGHSTLGIPKKVGEEYVGKDADVPTRAAGVALVAPDGDLLFVRRGAGDHAGTWAFPGGFARGDEDPTAAAIRELEEELGFLLNPLRIRAYDQQTNGLDYVTFAADVDEKFKPTLDAESTGYAWARPDDPPGKLHPEVEKLLSTDMEPDSKGEFHLALQMPNVVQKLAPTNPNGVKPAQDEDTKVRKASVNYGKSTGHDRCGNCVHFRGGSCERVAGDIDPGDWCELYSFAPPFAAMDGNVFAFDRESVRQKDADDRLHLTTTNISKANVCPYLGKEINEVMAGEPGWKELQNDRIYQLLRHPEEIRKAQDTFNNLPVLDEHQPVNAADHKPELVIGSTGTDASFSHPYLSNSMVIWAKPAIDEIESGARKELSSAYRYRADMTPGNYEGADYDGVMRDIVGNHVALVKAGRAGSDVVVGDSAENIINYQTELDKMTKLSRKAILVRGGLIGFLTPKLAKDGKLPDLTAILADVTAKNFVEKKPAIIEGVTAALKDVKLAKDAGLNDMHEFIDRLDKEQAGDEEPEPTQATVDAELDSSDTNKAADEDEDEEKKRAFDAEGLKDFLKDKISEDNMKALDAYMAGDEPPEFAGKPVRPGMDKRIPAMDEKKMADEIGKAVKAAHDAATKTQVEIRDAEKAVRPYVGELAVACDSAEKVYRTALGILGVKGIEGVHPSALSHLLKMQPVPGAKKQSETTLAMDSSAVASFHKRVPSAARIGHL